MNNDHLGEDHDEAVDDPDDRSRNYRARPGRDLRDDVNLAGWNERSVWGYDTGTGSFFAQLWRNSGDRDDPDVWLSGVNPPLPWLGCVVAAMLDVTGCDPVSVVRALGLAHPNPALRSRADIVEAATPLSSAGDAYTAGKLDVLGWVMGAATATPGGQRPWPGNQVPTVEEVVAEQYVITGRAYQQTATPAHGPAGPTKLSPGRSAPTEQGFREQRNECRPSGPDVRTCLERALLVQES